MPSIIFVETDDGQDSRFLIAGVILAGVACCLLLLLTGLCLRMLWRDDICSLGRRRFISYISLTGIWAIVALASALMIVVMKTKDQTYSLFVGDVYRYLFWIPLILISWQSDALLVWRFTLISRSCGMKFVSIAFLLSSMVVSVFFLLNLSRNIVQPGLKLSAISLWSISLGLNTLLTAMIVFYILRARSLLRSESSVSRDRDDVYLSSAVTLGISAILYCGWNIAVIVAYAVGAEISNTFVMPSGFIQAITSFLTIYISLRRSQRIKRASLDHTEWNVSYHNTKLESQSVQVSSTLASTRNQLIYKARLFPPVDTDIEKPCIAHYNTNTSGSLPLPSYTQQGQRSHSLRTSIRCSFISFASEGSQSEESSTYDLIMPIQPPQVYDLLSESCSINMTNVS